MNNESSVCIDPLNPLVSENKMQMVSDNPLQLIRINYVIYPILVSRPCFRTSGNPRRFGILD